MKLIYHYEISGYKGYELSHSEINDGKYVVFISGFVPRVEVENLMRGEKRITSDVLEAIEVLETYWKLNI